MFTTKPEKSNSLRLALLAMANWNPPLPIKKIPKSNKIRKTKKGHSKNNAHHIQGAHFKPVHLYEVNGKPMPPSMYRRLHLGVQNPRKQHGSQPTH